VPLEVVDAVERANARQKGILLPRIEKHLGGLRGRAVAVWGLAFKPKTDDMREAPALTLIEGLLAGGAAVRVYDPKAMSQARRVLGDRVAWCARSYDAVENADALVLVTEWSEFREPDFPRIKSLMRTPAIFDGRNIWSPEQLRGIGFHYEGVGRR
jgi:UDPglucose 6-dehydrogenase